MPSARDLASTGRRRWLRGAAATSLAYLARPARARATDYASAAEVLDAIDRLEADVDGRLAAIAREVAGARHFAGSVGADHAGHRAARARLRRRLKLPAAGPPSTPAAAESSLARLREAQQRLVHAHAEGLPALGNAAGVDLLTRHMVDASRHLTVIDLWIEGEEQGG
jgi:hypothetical protein